MEETERLGIQGQPGLHETSQKKKKKKPGKIKQKSIVKKLQKNHSFKLQSNIQGIDIFNFIEVLVSYRGQNKLKFSYSFVISKKTQLFII